MAPPPYVKLKVHPGSRKDEIVRRADDAYETWVRAPAERNLANASALALLSAALGVPAGRLRLVKGATSPRKIVRVL